MKRYSQQILILTTCVSLFAVKAAAQDTMQKPAGDDARKAPVVFKCNLMQFIKGGPNLPAPPTTTGTLDINIRNDNPSKTIQELEYEIYATDKQSGAEVAQVRRVDQAKIKPGEVRERRSLPWDSKPIANNCHFAGVCRVNLRIVRIKYDDGSEWEGKVEAEKERKASKN